MTENTELHFLKFRYTFNEGISLAEQMSASVTCLGLLTDNAVMRSVGIERLNNLGRPAQPHVHIFFATTTKIGALRKAFTRSDLYKNSNGRKANSLYSLTEEDDVKDENRFFRYVFKENRDFPMKYQKLPESFNFEIEAACAKEERELQIERNLKSEAKNLAPSTKDKLFEYLDGLNEQSKFTTKLQILMKIIEYYTSEEKSLNHSTTMGFLNTALIRYGILTIEQLALEWLK